MAQNPIIGSWTISSQEESGTCKYKNHQLLFNKNGIEESSELDNGTIAGVGSQRAVFNESFSDL